MGGYLPTDLRRGGDRIHCSIAGWAAPGQLGSLGEVVAFFSKGGNVTGYPGTSEIHALKLTADEQDDLVQFLEDETGKWEVPVRESAFKGVLEKARAAGIVGWNDKTRRYAPLEKPT